MLQRKSFAASITSPQQVLVGGPRATSTWGSGPHSFSAPPSSSLSPEAPKGGGRRPPPPQKRNSQSFTREGAANNQYRRPQQQGRPRLPGKGLTALLSVWGKKPFRSKTLATSLSRGRDWMPCSSQIPSPMFSGPRWRGGLPIHLPTELREWEEDSQGTPLVTF